MALGILFVIVIQHHHLVILLLVQVTVDIRPFRIMAVSRVMMAVAVVDVHTVSIIRATRLLNKGCVGFLAYVVVKDEPSLRLEEVPVVKNFIDVFPDDLQGLPPAREIEFTIDVLPDTNPISLVTYSMAPAELRELKIQL